MGSEMCIRDREHKDEVYFYPDCDDMTDVAHYFIDGAKRFLISA